MSFLPHPQVCVIDDEEAEYKHLLEALKNEGVGWVHVAGDKVETLPATPIEGLRIVFLDMHLGTDNTKTDREITAQTANVFTHVVPETTGPLTVIIWTKHSHLVESFRRSLFEERPVFKGKLFFIKWEKPSSASSISALELRHSLHAEMNNLDPLALLWGWSALVHRAASDVITELCKVASTQADLKPEDTEADEREKLLKGLGSILARLVQAETGKSGKPSDAPAALQRALEPLLADRVDHISPKPELEAAKTLIENGAGIRLAVPGVLTAINTMLLFGPVSESENTFRPGTFYKVNDVESFKNAMGIGGIDLAHEVCQKEIGENEVKRKAFLNDCHIVLIEVSPSCDFAQGKRPLARLVAGLLVPPSRKRETKTSRDDGYGALRMIPAEVTISAVVDNKSWTPVFTSSLVISWPEKNQTPFLTPIGRFKESLLTDFRNWLAHQGGRVGYLFLDTR